MDALQSLDPTLITLLLTFLYSAAIFTWIRYRTKSSFILWSFLWKTAIGEKTATNERIENFYLSQHDIHKFRCLTGVTAPTITALNAAVTFSEKHDIDIQNIAACGTYFDFDRAKLKLESPRLLAIINLIAIAGAVIALFLSIILAFALVSDSVFLRFRDTGTSFALTDEKAKPLFEQGFKLTECGNVRKNSGFTLKQIEKICDDYRSGELAQELINQLFIQRIYSALFLAPLLWFAFSMMREVSQYTAATRLERTIYNRALAFSGCPACGATGSRQRC